MLQDLLRVEVWRGRVTCVDVWIWVRVRVRICIRIPISSCISISISSFMARPRCVQIPCHVPHSRSILRLHLHLHTHLILNLRIPPQPHPLQLPPCPRQNLMIQLQGAAGQCEQQDPQHPTDTMSVVHADGEAGVEGGLGGLMAGVGETVTVAGCVVGAVEVGVVA